MFTQVSNLNINQKQINVKNKAYNSNVNYVTKQFSNDSLNLQKAKQITFTGFNTATIAKKTIEDKNIKWGKKLLVTGKKIIDSVTKSIINKKETNELIKNDNLKFGKKILNSAQNSVDFVTYSFKKNKSDKKLPIVDKPIIAATNKTIGETVGQALETGPCGDKAKENLSHLAKMAKDGIKVPASTDATGTPISDDGFLLQWVKDNLNPQIDKKLADGSIEPWEAEQYHNWVNFGGHPENSTAGNLADVVSSSDINSSDIDASGLDIPDIPDIDLPDLTDIGDSIGDAIDGAVETTKNIIEVIKDNLF